MYSFADPVTSRIMLRGSARPLASTTMTSRSEDRCASLSSIASMSLTSTAQHRQPLLSETIESTCPATIIESMLTDPKSLTTTPDPRASRVAQQVIEQSRLPGPEESGDDDDRDPRSRHGRVSPPSSTSRSSGHHTCARRLSFPPTGPAPCVLLVAGATESTHGGAVSCRA